MTKAEATTIKRKIWRAVPGNGWEWAMILWLKIERIIDAHTDKANGKRRGKAKKA